MAVQYPTEAFRPDSSWTSQLLEHLPAVRLRMQRESGTVSQLTATLAFESALHSASLIPSSLKPTILSDLSHYYQFCTRLRIPAYPITPDRVALHLARFVSLPHGSGSATEEVRRATGTISLRSTREIKLSFYSLKVAGLATAGLWRTTESFVGEPGDYGVTNEVAQGLDRPYRMKPARQLIVPLPRPQRAESESGPSHHLHFSTPSSSSSLSILQTPYISLTSFEPHLPPSSPPPSLQRPRRTKRSPHQPKPFVRGTLPISRRPPPLPVVLPQNLDLGVPDTSIAVHRTRRTTTLPKVVQLVGSGIHSEDEGEEEGSRAVGAVGMGQVKVGKRSVSPGDEEEGGWRGKKKSRSESSGASGSREASSGGSTGEEESGESSSGSASGSGSGRRRRRDARSLTTPPTDDEEPCD